MAHNALKGIEHHPGFSVLKKLIDGHANKGKILDVGCGEGSRLDYLLEGDNGVGIDINKYAIALAKKNFPRFKFIVGQGPLLPFEDNSFEVVYSTFVLEHTTDPETFLKEMVRVLKTGGNLIIMCPNFGAPNRRSPNSVENPVRKLIYGFYKDIFGWGQNHWTEVVPKKDYVNIDDDTTVEPYLLTLNKYINSLGMKVIYSSSLWKLEAPTLNPRKLLFKFLGRSGIYPFNYWGPQIFITAKK